jgi:type IV pilus assembly protein PilA
MDNFKILKNSMNQSGFTLVEILIVIVIIGIITAVGVPVFSNYRTRALNSSSLSDIKNLISFESALYTDSQMYGATEWAVNSAACSGGQDRTGTLITGGDAGGGPFISTQNANGIEFVLGIGLGKGVSMYVTTALSSSAYTSQVKHIGGDVVYGMEDDSMNIYQNETLYVKGQKLTTANEVAPTHNLDFAAAGSGWFVK